ncbi:MAG: metalloregulator ArsR/SmtB family transcription factor [Candidatus Obscuribacterales bacterium]|jgi:DNA-binding transcriptional ArsR family regulator|nr:metalloregulator ArsR/SmtB family transcription factor [Candidatus Obscuribacterales bacterium]
MLKKNNQTCCPVHVTFPEQEPISSEKAAELEDLFKILANDTRLRLLHTLARVEEMCVCDIADAVDMTPQAISNQLQRLSDRGIVATRRSGNQIYYRVVDECIVGLLQKALCLLDDSEKLARL